jgi:hypothetical protein
MSQITEQLNQKRSRNQQNKSLLWQQPIPNETRTYGPVANQELYNIVTERVRQHGLTIVDEEFEAAMKGQIMLCKLHINNPDTPGINRVFAFMNSYNKMRKVSFASGAVVLVCWNGMFWSDEGTFARRHYRNVWDEIHMAVDQQVEQMASNFNTLLKFKEQSEQVHISPQQAASLAGRMYFDGILSPYMLGDLKKEMYHSANWAFNQKEDGTLYHDSVWKFYNNCTEAAKRAPAHESVKTHSNITRFLAEQCGLSVN